MNILYLCQGQTLELFYNISNKINAELGGKSGFYIADSKFYDQFNRKTNYFRKTDSRYVVKEWDILAKSENIQPNYAYLNEKEEEYADPVFWNALISDRRIYFGKKATLLQDYKSKYSHSKMLSILQTAIKDIERLFDQLKPDVVIGFICVTIGEYLSHAIASKRNIQVLNLRPTRIKNYIHAGESIFEPSETIRQVYKEKLQVGLSDNDKKIVDNYIDFVKYSHSMYEGVLSSNINISKTEKKNYNKKFEAYKDFAFYFLKRQYNNYKYDSHFQNEVYKKIILSITIKMRKLVYNYKYKKFYISETSLKNIKYAFYPLHKEPEVSLLVYGRPYLNQIEIIRMLAESLPVAMKLIVKEHPACNGYRSVNYYKKILEIPNVEMVPVETESRLLVEYSTFVAIVSGSIGLEGVLCKKPVLHFGRIPFEILPNCMIQMVDDLKSLPETIIKLLKKYEYKEENLKAYIASVVCESIPIDFYSLLLEKKGTYRPNDSDKDLDLQIELLKDYLISKIVS